MTRATEKRLLLAWMALFAPLPLPFNEPRPVGVVGFPFLTLYLVAIGVLIWRIHRRRESWLSNRWLNVLGALYSPFLVFDLAFHGGSGLVTPMMHLALFALGAKLFSLRRERDKWHAVVGLFFVFVTAMATSASPAIVLYLVVFLVLWVVLLARFAHFHVLSFLHQEDPEPKETRLTVRRLVLGLCLATLMLSVPLFFAFPRLRNPFLFGPDLAPGGEAMTGFSDEVSLDGIGRIRTSSEVAMRIDFAGRPPSDFRFRGAAYELYGNNRWERVEQALPLLRGTANGWVLRDGRPEGSALVWLEPLGARSLILPEGTLEIAFRGRGRRVMRHRSETLSFWSPPLETISYEAVLGAPEPEDWGLGFELELDRSGITSEIAGLAARVVAGNEESAATKARAIESHLIAEYGYTLDFVGREGEDPLGEFLFRYRSGHCELFATAMVLMLRAVDVPARLVTGFSGAESSALGYHIVRQSNAHAWVEAFLPGRGWTVFDPTPPAGRPTVTPANLQALFRQAYDFAVFGWDRYVISYGMTDQRAVLERLEGAIGALLARFKRFERDRQAEILGAGEGRDAGRESTASGIAVSQLVAFAILVALVASVVLVWLRRRALDGRRAYQKLRTAARSCGVAIDDGTAPLEVAQRLVLRFPQLGSATHRIVDLYLQESYGGATLSSPERVELNERLVQTRRALRRAS
jgi:hypothetical protein